MNVTLEQRREILERVSDLFEVTTECHPRKDYILFSKDEKTFKAGPELWQSEPTTSYIESVLQELGVEDVIGVEKIFSEVLEELGKEKEELVTGEETN